MKIQILSILPVIMLILASCNSGNKSSKEADSSKMMDSGIMNHPDTLDPGPDTSVIDTPDTGRQKTK